MNKDLKKLLLSEKISHYKLSNGLTVILKEDYHIPIVSIQLWVRAGSIYEKKYIGFGLSHFLEHMLFRGTIRRTYDDINKEIYAAGGIINAYTTFDHTVYYIDGPSEGITIFIDILEDIIFHSTLSSSELIKEKKIIQREIEMNLDDPDYQLNCCLLKTAFRFHPYREPIIGHNCLLQTIKQNDLLNYYKSLYTPNNMTLIVTGNFNKYKVKNNIVDVFGKNRTYMPIPSLFFKEPKQLAKRELRIIKDYKTAYGNIAFKIPGFCHKDAPALDVLASIFGSGKSSVLWKKLRENYKIVDSIGASTWMPAYNTGLFFIYYNCEAGNELIVESLILEELKNFVVNQEQLDKGIANIIIDEINLNETINGQAEYLGNAELVLGDFNYPKVYFNNLELLNSVKLNKIINFYFNFNQLTCISLSPKFFKIKKSLYAKKIKKSSEYEQISLSNGIRIIMQPVDSLPKFNLHLLSLGGSLYENLNNLGSSALMVKMLTKDTKQKSAEQVSECVDNVGGTFTEYVNNNAVGLNLEFLTKDLSIGLNILDNAIHNPVFDNNTFLIEKNAQLFGIREKFNTIFNYGIYKLREYFFNTHPYCYDAKGSLETVDSITCEIIKDLYKKLFLTSNVVISISGSFDRNFIVDQLENIFLKTYLQEFEINNKLKHNSHQLISHRISTNHKQAIVMKAFPDVGIKDNSYYVGEVLCELYSNTASQLFKRVREDLGMAYFIGANRICGINSGMFYFFAGTHSSQCKDVLKIIDLEIERLEKGKIAKNEIEYCKNRLKIKKYEDLQNLSTKSLESGLNCLYNMPVNSWHNYNKLIDNITLEHLQLFIQKNFLNKNYTQLIINDKS